MKMKHLTAALAFSLAFSGHAFGQATQLPANQFWASPSGGPGNLSPRTVVTSDIATALTAPGPIGTVTPSTVGSTNLTLSAGSTQKFKGATSGTATVTPLAVAGTPTLTLPNTTGTFAVGATAPLVLNATTGNLTVTLGAATLSTPANPAGTASTTGVMMGLAGTITPATTGRVTITITGTTLNTLATGGSAFRVRFGTGTAPVNGAALTGTALGALTRYIPASSGGSQESPFSVTAFATGLAVSTPVWIDLQLAAVAAGTSSVTLITVNAIEF